MAGRVIRVLAVAVVVIGMLSACSPFRSPDPAPDAVPAPTETVTAGDLDAAALAFVVRYDETELQLAPVAWSLDDARGVDPSEPPTIGSPDEIFVFVPVADWSFSATQYTGEGMYDCDGITIEPEIEILDGGWYAIRPVGPAGDYTLEVSAASGPSLQMFPKIGEMTGRLRWTTPTGEPTPPAQANVSLVADNDGTLEAWDLMLEVVNLYPPTDDVSATVTVSASGGDSMTFALEPTGMCIGQTFNMVTPFTETQGVLDLGDPPFVYEVELTIDGETFTGRAEYTTGANTVPLEFDTPLP